jgi:hypothetical protein
MEEMNSMYISGDRQLFPAPKTGLFGYSLRPLNSDHQKEEKDATIIKKDLPADHY